MSLTNLLFKNVPFHAAASLPAMATTTSSILLPGIKSEECLLASSFGSPSLKSQPEKRHLNLMLHREAEPPSCAAPRSPFWATHGGGEVSVEAPRESGARERRKIFSEGSRKEESCGTKPL